MLRFTAVPPRVPALMGRVRLALKSDLAAEQTVAEALDQTTASTLRPRPAKSNNQGQASTPIREALEPYKDLKRQSKVNGCLELVDVREIMSIYRKFRESSEEPIPASDVVHAILSTLRLRMVVLRPLISTKRHNVVNEQNPELKGYLEEIVEDILAGKAYLSTFALTYLLTAFGTLNCHAEATKVWRQLSEQDQLPAGLSSRVKDPKVVGSFIRFADPQSVSLDEIELTYEDTVRSRGHHVLLDDALATSYLRYGESVKAAELYAHMCRNYPVKKWEETFSRLHNRILTESQDAELSAAFFESAVSDESRIRLHPSSVSKYLEQVATATSDPMQIVNIYRQAVERFSTKVNHVAPVQYQILTSTAVRFLLDMYKTDSAEARETLGKLLPLDSSPVVALNTLLSFMSKRWPTSTYIEDLMAAISRQGPLRVDSIRVFLNASQHLASTPLAAIEDLWTQRKAHIEHIDKFDLLALAQACNQPDRAEFFKKELAAARDAGASQETLKFVESRIGRCEHVAAVMST